MAETRINMLIEHPIDVGNVDVVFNVRRGQALLGRLKLSKGGLDWYPRGARTPRKASWQQFHAWMNSD